MDDLVAYIGDLSTPMGVAMTLIAGIIVLIGVIALFVSVILAIRYHKYNRRQNSAGLTGEQVARCILDQNGLQQIKVKTVGSMLFGNSYSHFFKKVRLRRRTKNRTSLAALGMGAQKAALAVLDRERDPDMKKRNRLIPLVTFGPFMFLPLLVVGAVLDYLVFEAEGHVLLIAAGIGVLFYLFSLLLSIVTLKTEKKAQKRAYVLLRDLRLASEDELTALKKLFKLYNIQYINNIVLSSLELLYYILRIFSAGGGAQPGTDS